MCLTFDEAWVEAECECRKNTLWEPRTPAQEIAWQLAMATQELKADNDKAEEQQR